MIEATAGSGKTTLMVQRLSDLVLKKNIPPDQCLAITFTEKAAKEMKDRLLDVFKTNQKVSFPIELVSKMTICTIHSFCQNVLSKLANAFMAPIKIYCMCDRNRNMKYIGSSRQSLKILKRNHAFAVQSSCPDRRRAPHLPLRTRPIPPTAGELTAVLRQPP